MSSRIGDWTPTLPDGWKAVRLRWVSHIYSGGTPDRENLSYWTGGDIPWMASGVVNQWDVDTPSEYITVSGLRESSARWVPSGALVMGLAGQGRTKGLVAQMQMRATVNQSLCAIVLGPSVAGRFALYWLSVNHENIRNLAGGDKRDGLNHQLVGNIYLPLPPLTEQRAIADYLDRETAKIDTVIEKQTMMIERLRERRVGLVVATVTRGLNGDVPTQAGPAWAGDVPASWRVLPLKRVLGGVQTGTWGTEPDGGNDDITCVRVADFDRPRLAVGDSDTLRRVSAVDRRRLGLRRGDLLIEKSGGTAINPVGFVAVYDTDHAAVCANFIGRMRFLPGQASRFWLYALHGSYASGLTWRHVKQTTGIQNLDLDSFVAEQFPVPPLDEQREIAYYLDRETAKIDTLIAKVERHIELAKERRAALITAAVTGQIDVTNSTQSGDAA